MGIIKNAINNQIQEQRGQIYLPVTGTIEEYSSKSNSAVVSYDNPNGDGKFRIENVPVSIFAGGISGFNGIQIGMECCIMFINGNVFSPVVVGVYNNFYEQKDMGDNGSCIVSRDILEAEKPSDIIPMTETWIDSDNENINKYINDYSNYINRDVDAFIYDTITNVSKFKDTEQGIVNIESGSGMKIKDNGDIDIFVDNNCGIRISRQHREVNFYGLSVMKGNDNLQHSSISNIITKVINSSSSKETQGDNAKDVELENTLSKKDISILKISTLIAEMNGKEESIRVVVSVLDRLGNPNMYGNIKTMLAQYDSYKQQFYGSKDTLTASDIDELYDNIYMIYTSFSQEISDILNNGNT